jgi:heme-degrading monooxygenase HmoA
LIATQGGIMFARVTSGKIKPDKLKELAVIVKEIIHPHAANQPGYAGYLLLTDPDTNKVLNISIWKTEESMRAGEQSDYYQKQIARAASTFADAPSMEHYVVEFKD